MIEHLSAFVLFAFFWAIIYLRMERANRGTVPVMKSLGALDAIDEAVGRASEMGKSVHFTYGKSYLLNTEGGQTVAGSHILHYVSRICARLGATIIATVSEPEGMALTIDSVEQAYIMENASDQFVLENIIFTGPGLAYNSYVINLLETERPAANIICGRIASASLLVAETGARVGAIQIAGTATTFQCAFFAAVCDYLLIGEELYAASAYVTKDPELLGAIEAQDILKLISIALVLIGFITVNLGSRIIISLLSY